jgi:hypothetical protein
MASAGITELEDARPCLRDDRVGTVDISDKTSVIRQLWVLMTCVADNYQCVWLKDYAPLWDRYSSPVVDSLKDQPWQVSVGSAVARSCHADS